MKIHKITEELMLEEISGAHLIQFSSQAQSASYQDHVQLDFKYLQGWRLQNLFGQREKHHHDDHG